MKILGGAVLFLHKHLIYLKFSSEKYPKWSALPAWLRRGTAVLQLAGKAPI
jgi:hypothetical protein